MHTPSHQTDSALLRHLPTALAGAIAVAFFLTVLGYWAGGADGGDRNGYLLEGKLFASGKISRAPADPFFFLGTHWVQNAAGQFLLKYPPGLPLLYDGVYRAAAILHAGGPQSARWANLVSPLCAALAVLGTYVLMRLMLSSFYALLGMLAVAVSPVTIVFALTPNSHACSMCLVVWGIVFVLKWYRDGGLARGVAAGLLLGLAATVRYSEASLLVPLLLAIVFQIAKRRGPFGAGWSGGVRLVGPIISAWLAPILAVALFNLVFLGHPTGYSLTGESTGFGLHWLGRNLLTMLIQLNAIALFFFFPLSLPGFLVLLRRARPEASIVFAWIVPTLVLYAAYYWAPQGYVLAYMRFILPAIPGLALAATCLIEHLLSTRPYQAIVAGLIAAAGIVPAFASATVFAEDVYRHNRAAVIAGEHVLAKIPAGSMLISEQRLLPHIETIGDYHPYLFLALTRSYLLAVGNSDNDSAQPLQPVRKNEMADLAKRYSDADLAGMQRQLIADSLAQGHRVFLVLPQSDVLYFQSLFLGTGSWKMKWIDVWSEDAALMTSADNPALASDAAPSMTAPMKCRLMQIVEITR